MAGDKKANWSQVKARYIAGEWINLREAAKALNLNYDNLKRQAAKGAWSAEKDRLETQAEEQAKDRVIARLTREFERSIINRLRSAEVLRFKGMESLTQEGMRLAGNDAIRAITEAASIENEIFTSNGRKPIRPADDTLEGRPNVTEEADPEEARAALHSRLARLAAGPSPSKGPGIIEPGGARKPNP